MEKQALVDLFLTIEPFKVLEPKILETLAENVTVKRFEAGTHVFKQGDQSLDALFIIVSGLVEITVLGDLGVETVVGLRKPGDFFSETVVLSRENYPASARVRKDLTSIVVPKLELEHLISTHPEFSSYFNTLLAERMRLMYEKLLLEQRQTVTSCVELPLFQKKVSEIMTLSVVTCHPLERVTSASKRMADKGISSAVVIDDSGSPVGLLTEKLLVAHLITNQTCPLEDCRVNNVMDRKFEQIPSHVFTGEALVRFSRLGCKYLIVVERGLLVGIVTPIDIVKSRPMGNLSLLRDLERISTFTDLVAASNEIDAVLNALLTEKAGVPEILEVMSELHERLIRAVIRLAEKEMETKGLGPPPVSYCWVNMGSDARHEQTLRTDQDNAIIYADPVGTETEAVDHYFAVLAGIVVDNLDRCGFKLCKGDVMATNPKWRRSLGQWLAHVDSWRRTFDPEDAITMTILLDFRPVWGDISLGETLWKKIFSVFDEPEKINHLLTREEMKFSVPLTFTGAVKTDKSGPKKNLVNIKTGGLVHIVNGIRLFAVNNEISEPSTLGRLDAITRLGVISEKRAEFFRASFETLVLMRIRTNLEKKQQNLEMDNCIDITRLSSVETALLKDALIAMAQIQKLIYNRFSQTALNFFS